MLHKSKGHLFSFFENLYEKKTDHSLDTSPHDIIYRLNGVPFCYLKLKDQKSSYLAIGTEQLFDHHNNIPNNIDYIFGSLDFEFNNKSYLFSPETLLKFENSGEIKLLKGKFPLQQLKQHLSENKKTKEVINTVFKETPDFKSWEKSLSKLKNSFNENIFKIVISRRISTIMEPKDWVSVLQKLRSGNIPSSYEYVLHNGSEIFYSVSPETFYKKNNKIIKIDSIAGTTNRGKSPKEDQILFNDLLNDPKELKEHMAVCDFIEKTAKNLGLELLSKNGLQPLKLNHIQHISSDYEFCSVHTLKDSILIDAFHPTPAVGGNSKVNSMNIIENIEEKPRGFYAAPSGFIDNINKKSEFLVAIRSFHFKKNGELEIFGGAGILKDSCPKKEWEETQNKMKNFLNKLNYE
tara:strand:+ start:521 stop:1738 length:1218 start_codon:yes stop_codon:yes gene_type:complete